MHPDHADFLYSQFNNSNTLSQREWKRVYSDAVKDAFQNGVEVGRDRGLKECDELIKKRIRQAWIDGYETCEEDSFHETKTSFDQSKFNEDNYDKK